MTSFADYSSGRNNNFNLLRFTLASLVIFTHAMGLTGSGDIEPLYSVMGHSFGSLAVDMFFVVSGFLIAKSWLSRKDVWHFTSARLLRIYPGLLVCVGLTVLVLGPLFTTLPIADYFTHIDTIKFFLENTTLIIKGVHPYLAGVFVGQGEGAVNVSLWTLPYELKMYALLLALALVGMLRGMPLLLLTFFAGFCYGHFLISGQEFLLSSATSRFIFFFFAGSNIYVWRNSIPFSGVFSVVLFAIVGAVIALSNSSYSMLALALVTPYLTLYLALAPSGKLQKFNACGDYSYGLYIYGFPVQQTVISLFGEQGWLYNFLFSLAATLLLSILSWHFIESRALKLQQPVVLYCKNTKLFKKLAGN